MEIEAREISEIFEDAEEIKKLTYGLKKAKKRLADSSKPEDDWDSMRAEIFFKEEKIKKLMKKFTQLDLVLLSAYIIEILPTLGRPLIMK